MHVEPVSLNAEAYDVALDISFPKGTQYSITVMLTPVATTTISSPVGNDFAPVIKELMEVWIFSVCVLEMSKN